MTLFEAACELGARVGPVMPVRGKVPLQKDWPTAATRTPVVSEEWQAATGIGLVTGERAGYFVLDVDGTVGAASLARLEQVHGALPPTWVNRTGGGLQLFFKHPGWPVRGSAGKLAPGLDVRGEGGQVVVPPSRHWLAEKRECAECMVRGPAWHAGGCSRSIYEWKLAPWALQPPPVAPAWLLELLRPRPEPVTPPRPRLSDGSDVLKRASAYLAKLPGAIDGSGGSNDAWKAALVVVRGFALGEVDAFNLLAAEYNPRCTPPWSEKELRHKVRDASQSASVTWGYLRDAERPTGAGKVLSALAPPREPGSDDDTDAPALPPQRFRVESARSLLAEVIPPTKWLLSPYVYVASFGELVGPPGKGKTTFMCWMIAQMAAAGYRCMIVEEEGSRGQLQRLLRRALACVGDDAIDRVSFMHEQSANIRSHVDIDALIEVLRGYDFVLFDSFALVTPGMDEDTSKEMGPVIDNLKYIRKTLRIAVWLNHHSGKTVWKNGEIPKLGDGRGSSALPAAIDAELSMRPCESRLGLIEFELFVTKMRGENDQIPPKHVQIDRNGSAASCEMTDIDVSDAPTSKASAVDKLADLLMKDVRVPTTFETAQPAGVIAKALRVNRMECIRAIKALCEDGMFEANAVTAKPYKKYHRRNHES